MSVKSDNFKRISDNRVKKITELISKLHNLCNPSFYEYTDQEIDELFDSIQSELDKQKEIFMKERKRGTKKVLL